MVPRLVVVTGGPGAGKTALLEVVRRNWKTGLVVLPESASIVFGGGFPRRRSPPAMRAAQRAIFRVQRELERMSLEEAEAPLVLCDRGTVDGAAYWPGLAEEFFAELGTSLEAEVAHYSSVLHLRTPPDGNGYDHSNPLRIETAHEAARIDARILELWSKHPRRHVIDSAPDFITKVERALAALRAEI